MRKVKVAATQMACKWNTARNLTKAEDLIKGAASAGAQIILLQELFETPYFCHQEKYKYFELATPLNENPVIARLSFLAKKLAVVLPVSFFERYGNTFFNSLVVIDADGKVLDVYRKTHIPAGHNYEEKFYFSPGDTGFKVWKTRYGRIGAGICWDQWFPETARILTLMGAEIIFYPTAIGSEPILKRDSQPHWQRTIQGHSAANLIPVVVSNRIGTEIDETQMTFYGTSFITDQFGDILKQADRKSEDFIVAELDLDEANKTRRDWGVFRDRRPEMYRKLLSM
ncbi:MAG: N-carbamoylputrescine amidase [Lentilactobacillus hilgardii]|uniref:N-carbamoylputrescine amidase n=1 Tax=Lentilactobacillus hilgardii TaxID=1588 RepID=UPI001CC1F6A6|nr:N-carbamoylputrescine amidase [Lentilactobacillus hilgardii]MBZ2200396.1 N-carbamoylputrescine amidase [Lentilactobacillus hilgardii]MBZ2204298.1 N-carbamoylputrescine amidase [Lentilactobacillus hilgardii]